LAYYWVGLLHSGVEAIDKNKFPQGVIQGLITFLHKGGVRKELSNWKFVTLLNVSYKIAKHFDEGDKP
jgi:hypothetical protein